jgi:O-antigen/teichoic acid export membrane protein
MKKIWHKITSHDLAKGSALVFAGTMVSNVCAYLYHLFMGRILGPVGYGTLSSLISLLYIFSVPTMVLSTVLAKYFSQCKALDRNAQAKYLFDRSLKLLSICLIIGFGVILILAPIISSFIHLTNWQLMIWVYLTFAVSALTIINMSLLQVNQIFFWYSLLAALVTILKLILSVPAAHVSIYAVVVAGFIAVLIGYALYFYPVKFIMKIKEQKFTVSKKDALLFSIPTLLVYLSLTSIYSLDVVLAKHFLISSEAGIYSALSILGKIIFYGSSAIALVCFPVISGRMAKKQNILKIALSAVLGVFSVSVVISTGYFIFPKLITNMLFGSAYNKAIGNLGGMGVFLSLYSLSYVMIIISLAINKTKIWIFPTLAAILQIALIYLFHSRISDIINVNIAVCGLLVVSVGIFFAYAIKSLKYTYE